MAKSATEGGDAYLYPTLDDPNFALSISKRKEFYDTRYERPVGSVKELAEKLCSAQFELAPHQLFVHNFLSFQTPYNSLLLYHGLGSGKTCSAIGVAEEMRDYMRQVGSTKRILVVAAPNVQVNFRLQLFDERRLKEVDGVWTMQSCTGNKYLREVNPMNMRGLSRDNVIKQINRLIDQSYLFMGYIEFANYIGQRGRVSTEGLTAAQTQKRSQAKLRKHFSNRLVIIDEAHNVRVSDDRKGKRVAAALLRLVKAVRSLRLLLLSATPMYNSHKEIVWLLNLLSINDGRETLRPQDVFARDGAFRVGPDGEEVGKDLLMRRAIGYVSFVRGENPYTFPYRIWPSEFAPDRTFGALPAPRLQLNGRPLAQTMEVVSLYLTSPGDYQQRGYDYIIDRLHAGDFRMGGKEMPSFANMEAFGYTMLQRPLEALNIVYPYSPLSSDGAGFDPRELVGRTGLQRLMTYKETDEDSAGPRYELAYRDPGSPRVFSADVLPEYSGKMAAIVDAIMGSRGLVMVYSQYIDGGLLPLALALEERGLVRTSARPSLFAKPPAPRLVARTMQPGKKGQAYRPARYAMITGDRYLSPDNTAEMRMVTNVSNRNGDDVKVVLISQAAAEGLDFKFVRQVHVLEPWYNMNRIEQIIGRAVRTCSHSALPFEERNVQIFLHGTVLRDQSVEAADIYVYRLAELKAVQIGQVTRALKECAVDCLLNSEQNAFTVEALNQTVQQRLSNGEVIDYAVGDKPYSATCDYMQSCTFSCRPNAAVDAADVHLDTFSEAFIDMNSDRILQRVRDLMKDRHFYRKNELVARITAARDYPLVQINAALTRLVDDGNEFITDKYGRFGTLVNIGDLYLFQPVELDGNRVSIRSREVPVDYKRDALDFDLTAATAVPAIAPPPSVAEGSTPAAGPSTTAPAATTAVIAHIRELREEAMTDQVLVRGETSWYKYFAEGSRLAQEVGITAERSEAYLLSHIVEELSFAEQLALLNTVGPEGDELVPAARKILTDRALTEGSVTAVLLQDAGEPRLAVGGAPGTWKAGTPEDYVDMKGALAEVIGTYTPAAAKLAPYVGFIADFKKKFRIFKVKDMSRPRQRGARCDQAGKGESVRVLRGIMGDSLPDGFGAARQMVVCVLQELVLREYDRLRRDGVRWYVPPGAAALVKIASLQR